MDALLSEIEHICQKYNFTLLKQAVRTATNLLHDKNIDIAIVGQFKAGKSSFFNSFMENNILPTGVVPVTSVITRVQYGKASKAVIYFDDTSIDTDVYKIDEFITENKNPNNEKHVVLVDVELPSLKEFKNIRFVDTPGIGSAYLHNTFTTQNWYNKIGIAFVTISAERPLGENELELIREISKHSPEVIILITKVDLFNSQQLDEISEYIDNQLENEFNRKFRIFNYSIISNTEKYRQTILSKIISPILLNINSEHDKIVRHKIKLLGKNCIAYLEIAQASSRKSDEEKKQLKKIIFDERINMGFIKQELKLIAESYTSQTREIVYEILEKHEAGIVSELKVLFITEYSSWNVNLFKLSRKYEEWMRNSLSSKLKEVAQQEQPNFTNIINNRNAHFGFFSQTLREKLNENIYRVLGIKLTNDDWKPEFGPLQQPNISIYRAFDTQIDLLWFLFPMFIFKKIFRKYFLNQLANEVSKNL